MKTSKKSSWGKETTTQLVARLIAHTLKKLQGHCNIPRKTKKHFILKEIYKVFNYQRSQETILDFSQGTVPVL